MTLRKRLAISATLALLSGISFDAFAQDAPAKDAPPAATKAAGDTKSDGAKADAAKSNDAKADGTNALGAKKAGTTDAPKLNSADSAQLSTNYKSLQGHVATLEKNLDTIRKFKGSDEELAGVIDGSRKAIEGARTNLDGIIEVGKKVEWSKVPRFAERTKSELETISVLLDEVSSAEALGTSIRSEFRQSKRALKKNLNRLAKAPLMAQVQ